MHTCITPLAQIYTNNSICRETIKLYIQQRTQCFEVESRSAKIVWYVHFMKGKCLGIEISL